MKTASINIKEIENNASIIKPTYHLNDGKLRIYNSKISGVKSKSLEDSCTEIFTGGIFKRVFVEDAEFGIPYISAQHMMSFNPTSEAKTISKKYTPRIKEMMLKESHILVSCAGTVGNIRYISKDLTGLIGSQDIIRIIPDEAKLPAGFLYAYLSCPTIFSYIQSYVYGSVVPRIEPKTLSKLPILSFDEKLISMVDGLIKKSANLRADANFKIGKAHELIEECIFKKVSKKHQTVKTITSGQLGRSFQKRLDASFQINKLQIEKELKSEIKLEQLKDLVSQAMFTAQRGKRNYVSNGIQFLSTSDVSQINPLLVDKFLSWQTNGLNTLVVEDDWILVASSGSEILGSAFLVDKTYSKSAVNQHSIRVIINENKISPLYVFAYLSSNRIKEYIRSGIYGSAILTINEDFLGNLLIPILDKTLTQKIVSLATDYKTKKQEACYLEKEAIEIIENQIKQWQK
ncbi:MAG: restriction endonuclease subunit S [Sediminibacterium sp.]|nr:restriction endonuclease subunit S [Sediminibacterium sp.]